MNNPANLTDIEIRIAFLEDQNDGLNHEFLRLQRENERLREELNLLTSLIKPMLKQSLQSGGIHDDIPPHF